MGAEICLANLCLPTQEGTYSMKTKDVENLKVGDRVRHTDGTAESCQATLCPNSIV
jgi:hypothetical protein